jgi:hypothetical protein
VSMYKPNKAAHRCLFAAVPSKKEPDLTAVGYAFIIINLFMAGSVYKEVPTVT